MKKLINLLGSFSLFTLVTTNVIACMGNETESSKNGLKKSLFHIMKMKKMKKMVY